MSREQHIQGSPSNRCLKRCNTGYKINDRPVSAIFIHEGSMMNKPKKEAFREGQVVYNRLGRLAEYVTPLTNGYHAVRPMVFDEEMGEDMPGVLDEWPTVFGSRPVGIYDDQVERAKKQLKQLQDDIQEAYEERSAVAKENDRWRKKFMTIRAVSRIEDCIDGKISHYVKHSNGYPEIVTLADSTRSPEKDTFKLLSLMGRTNGDLEWRLYSYSNESGGSSIVHPCMSIEEAEAVRKEMFDGMVSTWEKDHRIYPFTYKKPAWVVLPENIKKALYEYRLKGLGERKEDLERSLSGITKEMEELSE